MPLGQALEALIDHRGKTPKKLGGDWSVDGHRVVSALNIKNNTVDGNEHHFISEELYEKWMKVKLRAGDVLLTSEAPTGEAAYLADDHNWALGQRVFGLRGKKDLLDGRFLFYALRGGGLRHDLMSRTTGTTVQGIRQSELVKVEIDLPELDEQRAIAATLGALDDKIESNRRAVGKVQELGDTLFTSAVDERRVISEIATITMGTSPKGDTLNEVGDGVDFYQGTRDFGFRFPSQRIWTTNPIRLARRNDTLMSVRAPVGELNRAVRDCCVGRGVAAIHSEKQPSTLYYAMRASRAAWDKFQGDGTVFASVNKQDVHDTEINWVADDRAERLEQELSSLDSKIESLERESGRLISLRDTLLPALLSGSIRVPFEGAET